MAAETPLPARADVVVIGAGLAGLSVLRSLAHRGIAAVLLDSSPVPGEGSASAAGIGLVEVGTPEPFHRSVGLLGAKNAARVHEISRRNALMIEQLAGELGGFFRTGSCHLTTDSAELAELKSSANLLMLHVPDAPAWEIMEGAAAVFERTGTEGFIGGVFRPEDAIVDGERFLEALAEDSISRGARLCRGVEVTAIQTVPSSGQVVRTGLGDVEAEMVVLAAGAGGVTLSGLLRERVVPVLGQGLSLRGLACDNRKPSPPVSANFGHFQARMTERDGEAGLRAWIIPWSLQGSDPEGKRNTILEETQKRMESYLAARFPVVRAPDIGVDRRWAAHTAWTSDSLPLAGPVPGQPRLVLCTGFSGRDWNLACAVSCAVAAGIAGERATEDLDLFSPRRFMTD